MSATKKRAGRIFLPLRGGGYVKKAPNPGVFYIRT
jgi:hypothetical protein